MNIWESDDKLIRKEIMCKGIFSNKPTELSVCKIYVDNPLTTMSSIKQVKEDFYTEIVDKSSEKVIVIGEACSKIDRDIEKAIQTMYLNEQSLITVQIPKSNASSEVKISLEVTLKTFEFYKPIWEWTPEEKYMIALKYKEKGVELFKAKRYIDAFFKFSQGCKILITLEPLQDDVLIKDKILDLRYILYNNMAECQLVRENYEHTITLCNKVLCKDENNIKALYRRGIACGNLNNYEKAVEDLKMVISLEPKNKKALEKFKIYNKKWLISVERYENIVRKMFKA